MVHVKNVSIPEAIVLWFSHAQGRAESLNGFVPVERLGKGGFGSVYKAVNSVTGGTVAVKLLSDDLDPDDKEGIAKREKALKKEFKLFSSFDHPNLIPIYDLGRIKGRLYIVMEFADNGDLDQRLRDKRRSLSTPEKLDVVRQITAGMTHIAEQGLIHGDVKPANMLLFSDGRVKVTDFGLSRRKGWSRESVAKGTAFYMAPEQILKKGIGEYSDIDSLGVMLYEIFTGVRPFPVPKQARSGGAKVYVNKPVDRRTILKQHIKKKPLRPSSINPRISGQLEQIIVGCLEKKVDKRYQKLQFVWTALINCPEYGSRI